MLDIDAYLLFVGFGCYGLSRSYRDLKRAYASRTWPRTTGTILTSKQQVEKDEEGDTHRGFILYAYEVGGTPYRSGRVFCGDELGLGWKRTIHRYMAAYPVGKAVTVYYDPQAPGTSLLEPGFSLAGYVAFLIPALLTVWGLAALLVRCLG